ncbi:disease resistance protein, partial [Trifolium medium]|nr:disease resistance protein [Trifolium medium]
MVPLTLCQFLKSIPGIEWLKQQLIQLKLYEARLGELEGAVDVLIKELESVIKRVNEEENRYGKVRTGKVKAWIDGVDVIISEYNEFIEDKCLDELAVLNFFTTGYLPKPGIRYCRSKRAYSIITKVNQKQNTAKFDKYAEWSGPPSKAAFLLNDSYEYFPSRDEIVKKLKAALGDPNVKMIGLYGLKGVGKSTMVKEVAKEVEANQNFVMTMANLEGNPGIRQIQGEIAGWLGITLVEESDSARAAQLEDHLKKKNTLVILDHLCAKLDFKLLGIPSLND